VRIVRDVGLAEDLAQDALVSALEQWPESGVPQNPGAWLMATARRRAIDHFRHRGMAEQKHEQLGREIDESQPDNVEAQTSSLDDDIATIADSRSSPAILSFPKRGSR
jgi:predicted RNA polymerase sigma factor